jgi:hypothetical protein
MSDLMVFVLGVVLVVWAAAWCMVRVTGVLTRVMAQAETGVEQERTLAVRFADQLLAQGDANALVTLLNARALPDQQRGTVPDMQANGDIGARMRSAREALNAQRADRLSAQIEALQSTEGVVSGPGHLEEP